MITTAILNILYTFTTGLFNILPSNITFPTIIHTGATTFGTALGSIEAFFPISEFINIFLWVIGLQLTIITIRFVLYIIGLIRPGSMPHSTH